MMRTTNILDTYTVVIDGEISLTNQIDGEYGVIYKVSDFDYRDRLYEGEYTVTPKVYEQSLKTKQKYLIDDVTVQKIPYSETSNTSDGLTVYIG